MSSGPWRFERPSEGAGSEQRHCCRCDAVIPKSEAKYDTAERGYVCFACKNKKRREFLAKLVAVLATGIGVAVYFGLRLLRGLNRRNKNVPDD
jgi:hypothetical protein